MCFNPKGINTMLGTEGKKKILEALIDEMNNEIIKEERSPASYTTLRMTAPRMARETNEESDREYPQGNKDYYGGVEVITPEQQRKNDEYSNPDLEDKKDAALEEYADKGSIKMSEHKSAFPDIEKFLMGPSKVESVDLLEEEPSAGREIQSIRIMKKKPKVIK
jgi:hypothetical protein